MIRTLREAMPRLLGRRSDLERVLGVRCRDRALYEKALRHRSVLRRRSLHAYRSNERLEYLGDAVLGFIVAEYLYNRFPYEPEGYLTTLRSKLVSGQALSARARELGLGKMVVMSDEFERSGGRETASVLADTFEAVIGALYLDRGVKAARRFIRRVVLETTDLARLAAEDDNFKSLLLELAQANGWGQPQYRVIKTRGPGHVRTFTVVVSIEDMPLGRGEGGSKKHAEKEAARLALQRIGPLPGERKLRGAVGIAGGAPQHSAPK